ncbi:MAG: VOC family protein [Chloroflexi bacterium]|nr:VOC family protein [Chloroflexota bacterium]
MLRMRQICLVASDLDAVQADLSAIFGLEVCFRDPEIGRLGLHNFLMPVGNNFLEVVAPMRDGTTAERYIDRRGGDGGYMVITQCDDIMAARERVARLNVRLVADMGQGEDQGIQLHPKDVPGAIVELRQNHGADLADPPWDPAGPDWAPARRMDVVRAMVAAEIQTDDPPALAARWGEVFDRQVKTSAAHPEIALDDATIRFVPATDGRPEGLGGLDLQTVDRRRVLEAAEARGCRVSDDLVMVCGVRFRLL